MQKKDIFRTGATMRKATLKYACCSSSYSLPRDQQKCRGAQRSLLVSDIAVVMTHDCNSKSKGVLTVENLLGKL